MDLIKYELYQLSVEDPRCFRSVDDADAVANLAGYTKVFAGTIPDDKDLLVCENLFVLHNMDGRPRANVIRSMSVSDVVALIRGDKKVYYVCRPIGFTRLPNCK